VRLARTYHGRHLVQLTRFGVVNCFLLQEDDGLTLVDTGVPGTENRILEAATSLGAPIVRVAVTHAHLDHVGSLDALHVALPSAEVCVPARDARFLAGDHSLDAGEPRAKPRGSYPRRSTRPDRLLEAGDRVGSLEVVASPGHTPGHMSFLDVRDRTLLAGDAFHTQGGTAVSGDLRPLFPFPALATWHRPTALRSARALRALAPSRLAVGHGPTLSDPWDAIDAAIARAA
jgi:glyoxylase-like metal-dependent hydrolase (beta-lactamase superfamily II)